ncbi:hypothetical protein [Streptomyces poriticola]|uniref:hypothetical protein n=1 Tax=Streptomyces poriticola TaxID=3120506 RepID=UPI002FCE13A5
MRRTTLAALCLVAAATVTATGCRSGQDGRAAAAPEASAAPAESAPPGPFAGLTGGEIADRAVEATTGASSLRMKGDVPDDETGGTIGMDLALNRRGDCAGTLIMEGEGRADLIKTGDTLYLKYDERFLRAQSEGEPAAETDAVVDLLAGKWTRMSATGRDAEEMAGFCDLDSVLGEVRGAGSDAGRGETTTVGGVPAIVLHERDGRDRYTLYVATEGEPYLLRVDSTSAADPGSVTFEAYDEPVPARRPAGEILDLDALGG